MKCDDIQRTGMLGVVELLTLSVSLLFQEVLHTICSSSGQVLRIVIFKKNGIQAMVEYPLVQGLYWNLPLQRNVIHVRKAVFEVCENSPLGSLIASLSCQTCWNWLFISELENRKKNPSVTNRHTSN
jgi:hypothetical protein